jgi:hypothetical protein
MEVRRDRLERRAERMRWNADHEHLGVPRRLLEIVGRVEGRGQLEPGQVAGVLD